MGEAISALETYEVLKEKLGDEATRKLISYLDEKVRGEVATRADLELTKGELRTEIEKVRADLKTDIEKVRADIIKWMFLFWIGQVASIAALLKIAGVF